MHSNTFQSASATAPTPANFPPPGKDPVADHTWCCEHPEPWHYFDPEAYQRLLSGLRRVFRVDPVETAWSLRIAAWVASEDALPVLEEMLADPSLAPGSRREAEALRRVLLNDPDSAQNLPPEAAEQPAAAADRARSLIERLGNDPDGCEPLWFSWFAKDAGAQLSAGQRHHLALALAACGRAWGRLACAEVIAKIAGGISPYELYEIARAFGRCPMAAEAERKALRQAVQSAPWWSGIERADPALALVIAAALGFSDISARLSVALRPGPFRPALWRRTDGRRALAEALRHSPSHAPIRLLRGMLDDPGLGVRREAARTLWHLSTAESTNALVEHLRKRVLRNRALLDIEGVDVIRYAVDALLRDKPADAMRLLAALLEHPACHIHDLGDRLALTLCALGSDSCLIGEPKSGLPWAVHAALTPLPIAPWEALAEPVILVARFVSQHGALPGEVPSARLSHLERVRLQRALLASAPTLRPRTQSGSLATTAAVVL